MFRTLLLFVIFAGLPAQAAAPARDYAEGQVWEYRTRPGETGSLLRIQRIEPWPGRGGPPGSATERVYHISVIGLHFPGQDGSGEIQHLPVSRVTLDASVTRLSRSDAAFPSPDEGIAMWRDARGGVFDIPLAQIIDVAERTVRGQTATEPASPVT